MVESTSAAPRTATSSRTRSWTRRCYLVPAGVDRCRAERHVHDRRPLPIRGASATSTVDCQPGRPGPRSGRLLAEAPEVVGPVLRGALTRQVPGIAPRGTTRLPSRSPGRRTAGGAGTGSPTQSGGGTRPTASPSGPGRLHTRGSQVDDARLHADSRRRGRDVDRVDNRVSERTCGGTVSRAHAGSAAGDGVEETDAARPGASRSSATESTSRDRERKVMTSPPGSWLRRRQLIHKDVTRRPPVRSDQAAIRGELARRVAGVVGGLGRGDERHLGAAVTPAGDAPHAG